MLEGSHHYGCGVITVRVGLWYCAWWWPVA